MASLNDTQKEQVRYYCGYGMLGLQTLPASGYRFSVVYGTLEYKMINLQDGELAQVVGYYLVQLPLLETDITSPNTRSNLDTLQAAVWKWNPKEIRDRVRLFNYLRLQLCVYLGIPPGEGLAGGVCLSI